MRAIYMGTPDFAVVPFEALMTAGHEIRCVYTQPPRPAGRGQSEQQSAVHRRAVAAGIEVRTPASLGEVDTQQAFAALDADVAVVAAYGLILPQAVLAAPRFGCLNIHASLLPRWRGAAPIQHAIWAGDAETGITIMQMEAGLDSGPVLRQDRVPITAETTAGTLHETLAGLGGRAISAALRDLAAGALIPRRQDDSKATYAHKLSSADGRLDWTRPAAELERQVRALTPWPGTWIRFDGGQIRVLEAAVVEVPTDGEPGDLETGPGLVIRCGDRAGLRLCRVQRPGKRAMPDEAFRRGLRRMPDSLAI